MKLPTAYAKFAPKAQSWDNIGPAEFTQADAAHASRGIKRGAYLLCRLKFSLDLSCYYPLIRTALIEAAGRPEVQSLHRRPGQLTELIETTIQELVDPHLCNVCHGAIDSPILCEKCKGTGRQHKSKQKRTKLHEAIYQMFLIWESEAHDIFREMQTEVDIF